MDNFDQLPEPGYATFMLSIFGNDLERELDQLRRELNIRVGSNVGEIGGGDGDAAQSMSHFVGPLGKVYVTEIDREKVAAMLRRVQKEHISNITVLHSDDPTCNLPPLSCDSIYIRSAYHHLTDPENFLHSVYEALRPDGLVAVIDFTPVVWMKPWTPPGIPSDRGGHGMPKGILVREMEEAGFVLRQKIDRWFGRRYCYIFYKGEYFSEHSRYIDKALLG